MVFNDEAHHCYADRPLHERREGRQGAEGRERGGARLVPGPAGDREARRHQADLRPLGHAVLPQGLWLQRGLHLPVDGQRLLADGRDRVGHRQGAAHSRSTTTPTDDAGHLPAAVGLRRRPSCPKRSREGHGRRTGFRPRSSKARCAASTARYEKAFAHWETSSPQYGETPPVFIVVCPNTVVSQARLRLDRRRAGRRGRRGRRPQARQARAAQQRRRRQAARPAAHDPHRLRAARVRRGDEGRLQEGRGRGDRGVQGTSTAGATPAPTSRRSPTRSCCAR